MSTNVTVIDYGLGNLFSVRRALEANGGNVELADTPEKVLKAERLVLPGVGSFKDGMALLESKNLVEPILEATSKGRPMMGICLGMQLLLSIGYEFGETKGLGLIEGNCSLIPNETKTGERLKRPHIGWSVLEKPSGIDWSSTPLRAVKNDESVYFVHSYGAVCKDERHVLAYANYGGNKIAAAIYKDNVCGLQFHPERSGEVGLRIMKEFLR